MKVSHEKQKNRRKRKNQTKKKIVITIIFRIHFAKVKKRFILVSTINPYK